MWRAAIDTFEESPRDIAEPGLEMALSGSTCLVQPRTVVVLVSR
jgi:hypothetical protein